jgi:DNA-binding response OmpR family regulator
MMPSRIIVADKDSTTSSVLTEFFSSSHVQFAPVQTAADLKKAIKTQNPSAIVLDPSLADLPTWQAAHKIVTAVRNSKEYKNIPIIILGGDPGGPTLSQLQSLGADGYLNKPLEKQTAVSTLEPFLKSTQPFHVEMNGEDIVIDFDDDDDDDEAGDSLTEIHSEKPELEPAEQPSVRPGGEVSDLPVSEDSQDLEVLRTSNGSYDLRLDTIDSDKPLDSIDPLEASLLEYDIRGGERPLDINDLEPDSDDSILGILGPSDDSQAKAEFQFDHEALSSNSRDIHEEPPEPEIFSADSLPTAQPDDLENLHSNLTGMLPEKGQVLEQVARAISEAFPTRDQVLAQLDIHMKAIMPSKKDVLAAFALQRPGPAHHAEDEFQFSDIPISPRSDDKRPDIRTGEFSSRPADQSVDGDLTEKAHLNEEPLTIDSVVKTILREKIEEIMPEPNQILSWFREEIDRLVLETVEKIIERKVEEITSDSAS